MKTQIILLLITLFAWCSLSHSQQCLSDEYMDFYKEKYPNLESKIKTVISEFELKNRTTKESQEKSGEQIITIPVVFNIIHYGESEGNGRNLSDEKIQEQVDIMNLAFSGHFGGIDTKIQFCLASKDAVGQETTGINRYFGASSYDISQTTFGICVPDFFPEDTQIKSFKSSIFPENLYLNFWTTDLKFCGTDALLGYSSFPYYTDIISDVNDIGDGIVLDYAYVGSNSTTNSLGMTAVHEVGHWLGLFHTFEDSDGIPCNSVSCDLEDDMICDTPSVPSEGTTNIAPGDCMGYDCDNQTTNAVQNFMDYHSTNRFHCRRLFTEGQKVRMRDILSFYRPFIYNQDTQNSGYCGGPNSSAGSGGADCINTPSNIQSYYISPNQNSSFGQTIDANETWLITIDESNDKLLIYKKIGCTYVLHQVIDMPFDISTFHYSLRPKARFYRNDIILKNDEIIVSSFADDSVRIFKYEDTTDLWVLNQSIYNSTANTRVGSGIKVIDNFLFILEYNQASNNSIRIYRKEPNNTYSYHQTLISSSIDFPSLSKCIVSKNTIDTNINITSPYFTGTYNPTEVILAEYQNENLGNKVALLELDSSYNWVIKTIQPLPSHIKNIHDIEASDRFFYIVAGTVGQYGGNIQAHIFYFSYNSTLPINTSSSSFVGLYFATVGTTGELASTCDFKTLGRDEFFIYNHLYWHFRGAGIVSNSNSISSNTLPNFTKVTEEYGNDEISMCYAFKKINGNTMFSISAGQIRIYNLKDAFESAGYDNSNIESTFSREICSVPNDFLTTANQINLGGICDISFNYEHKEFVAKESIILKKGSKLNNGSKIKLRINNELDLCDGLSRSYTDNSKSKISTNELYIEKVTLENNIKIYPNPTIGSFKVSSTEDVVRWQISNKFGKSLLSNIFKNPSVDFELNIYNLPSDIYFLEVTLKSGEVITGKIIKN